MSVKDEFRSKLSLKPNNGSTSNQFQTEMRKLPPSSELSLIFPWCEDEKTFRLPDVELLERYERVTAQDIETVLQNLRQSDYYDLYKDMNKKLWMPYIGGLVLATATAMWYARSAKEGEGENLAVVVLFALFLAVLVMSLLTAFFWSRYLQRRIQARQLDFEARLNDLNGEIFVEKELFWKTGKFGTYLQLDLNYLYAREPRDTVEPTKEPQVLSVQLDHSLSLRLTELADSPKRRFTFNN